MTGKRVLYQEPQATFFHDVMTNLFTDKITKAATYYNLHPSNSELMSWGNNAPKIKDLLQLSGVTDTYVTFEYLVPYNMKRIDCILYGRNSQNQGNVVHIELKQWDNKGVRDADCEGTSTSTKIQTPHSRYRHTQAEDTGWYPTLPNK